MTVKKFRNIIRVRPRRMFFILSTVLCSGIAVPIMAQGAPPPPPENQTVDGNNVDLLAGKLSIKSAAISMGQTGSSLAYSFNMNSSYLGWSDNIKSYIDKDETGLTVLVDAASHKFIESNGVFSPKRADGSSLVLSGTIYTYTDSAGLVAHFDKSIIEAAVYPGNEGFATDVRYPSGHVLTYFYTRDSGNTISRIASVSSNIGYNVVFRYYDDDPFSISGYNWFIKIGADLTNTLTGSSASLSLGYGAALSSNGSGFTITDNMGRATQYISGSAGITGVVKPGSAAPDVTFTYDADGRINSATDQTGLTQYAYVDADGIRTTTVTDPLSHVRIYRFSLSSGLMVSRADAKGSTTQYQYDGNDRLVQITYPEGNSLKYTYDSRGNIIESRQVSKTPGTPLDQVSSAGYSADCVNAASCNKPVWTRDPTGNQTDYTYDPTTGYVLTAQAPAAAPGAERPTTSNTYASINGMQVLSESSTCAAAATCAGSPSEVKTSIAYNGNALPVTVTAQAGDGSIVSSTSTGYDGVGNVTSVDGPLPGADDTVTSRYNADREVVGVIGSDPDGAGPLKRKATRITYDGRGRATLGEIGAVADASDASWVSFAAQQQIATTYDGADRPLAQTLSACDKTSTTSYAYDHQRLDQETLSMGGTASDRVTKYGYDENDRQTKTTAGFGTPEQSDVATTAYTVNGKVASVTDGNGNITAYGYDGIDQPFTTTYPGGSYEQFGYDANGNVLSRRLRDGQTIAYGYDALNRLTAKTLPGEPAVSYGYDLLGRQTSATSSLQSLTFGYDALGHMLTQTGPLGTMTSAFDVAGRRTQLTWADGVYVTYDYNAAGQMTAVRENGSFTLASYGYDDLGNRTSVTRGNGVTTTYTYGPLSRLQSLSHDLAGTAGDLTMTFDYNSALQIISKTRSNPAYDFANQAVVSRPYGVNPLNQYTSAASEAFGYDGRGNLTSSGATGYTYSIENLLTSALGATLSYDPLLRLSGLTNASATTSFAYDGVDLVAEYDAANTMTKRYVFGAATDEPIVWYEGAGTTDRRYLVADERGSVVAVTDGVGNSLATNTYDEYGIPGPGNSGRFQYTGQIWLSEVGLYHYKARAYSPTLGRFMQIDPIGYADGLNLYNYAGSDPINAADPSGTLAAEIIVYGSGGGGGSSGAGFSVSGALGLIPGATLGSFGPRPEPEPESEEIVVEGVRDKPAPTSGSLAALQVSPVSLLQNDGMILEQQGRRNGTGKRGEAGKNPNQDKHGPKKAFGKPGYVTDEGRDGQRGRPRPARPGEPGFGEGGLNFSARDALVGAGVVVLVGGAAVLLAPEVAAALAAAGLVSILAN